MRPPHPTATLERLDRRPGSRFRALWSKLARSIGLGGPPPKRRRPATRRLRFTREGRYFVGLSLGVGFAAINTGNNLLYLVLGMMLSMIVVSGILSELALKSLGVERTLPVEVHAGSPYLTGIAVHNAKQRLASFSVQIEDLIDGHPLAKKCYFLKIPPQARQNTSYRSEFKRRGLYEYRGFHLSTRFPFAFFVKTFFLESPAELIVLPRIHAVALPADERPVSEGARVQPQRGRGRDFHGLRPHRQGDDARDIHWKRSAREGRLIMREYETEAGRHVGIVLNTRLAAAPTSEVEAAVDRAVDLAASLVVHYQRRGYEVELQAGTMTLCVHADGRGLFPALRALALVEFTVDADGRPRTAAPARARSGPGGAAGPGGERWLLVQPERGGLPADTRGFSEVMVPGPVAPPAHVPPAAA